MIFEFHTITLYYSNNILFTYFLLFWYIIVFSFQFLELFIKFLVHALLKHQNTNRGMLIFFGVFYTIFFLLIWKIYCISVSFYCLWIIWFVVFGEYVFILSLILITCFTGFQLIRFIFFYCNFSKTIFNIMKSIPKYQGIHNSG